MAGAVSVGEWRLRPLRADEREWAYALHRAALGEYVEATWRWDEPLQRRMFADPPSLRRRAADSGRALSLHVLPVNVRAVALYERCGLRVVAREPTRLTMRVAA